MTWVLANLPAIAAAAWSHLWLTLPTIVLSLLLSTPIGWVAHRYSWSRFTLLTAAGLLYAIPSLPLFIFLPLLLGTSVRDRINVVVAMTLYGIALMSRSAADAFDAVPADAQTSATAVGYAPLRRFVEVQLPLAGPGILAGLRVVSVSTVALVTVSAVLGVDNLGMLFVDGFQRNIIEEVITGIVATVVLAIALDLLLVACGRALMPWTRVERSRGERAGAGRAGAKPARAEQAQVESAGAGRVVA